MILSKNYTHINKIWLILLAQNICFSTIVYKCKYETKNMSPSKFDNFRLRKTVHYTLILCILLIQVALAGFIYNEFKNREDVSFIENQLKEIDSLELLTNNSRKELFTANSHFQNYLTTDDANDLEQYFVSINNLNLSLDKVNNFKFKNSNLNSVLKFKKRDSAEAKKFKILIDSTYQVSTISNLIPATPQKDFLEIKKYKFDYSPENFVVRTQTFSDTIQKKGLFGRIKDAIVGNENVRKDSTVVTMMQRQREALQLKNDMDSLINQATKHYTTEVKRVQKNIINNQNNAKNLYQNNKLFSELLLYSNDVMSLYDSSIQNAKSELEKEIAKQNSENNTRRIYLAIGAMLLMFIASILLMYMTKMAFVYENKLKEANLQIKENLNFKNRILGMLSHELRSPLKIIGIFINRINKKTNDESIKDYLKSISFTNNSLLMQANQILEYTKNQHVENKLSPIPFNLKNEITAIANSMAAYIETRHNQFVIIENIDPNIEVYSDNTKINQLFMNILGNANKFTEHGKISLITKASATDNNQILLETEVKDTGAGISASDLKNIFEPYYQGVLSNEVENLGAGLGLSLCKELVELFNGAISVDSQPSKGTSVKFSLNLNLKK